MSTRTDLAMQPGYLYPISQDWQYIGTAGLSRAVHCPRLLEAA